MAASYERVWNHLAKNGPLTAAQVGEVFYPEASRIGTANGGPSRGCTQALWLLGRMARRGMVRKEVTPGQSLWWVVRAADRRER